MRLFNPVFLKTGVYIFSILHLFFHTPHKNTCFENTYFENTSFESSWKYVAYEYAISSVTSRSTLQKQTAADERFGETYDAIARPRGGDTRHTRVSTMYTYKFAHAQTSTHPDPQGPCEVEPRCQIPEWTSAARTGCRSTNPPRNAYAIWKATDTHACKSRVFWISCCTQMFRSTAKPLDDGCESLGSSSTPQRRRPRWARAWTELRYNQVTHRHHSCRRAAAACSNCHFSPFFSSRRRFAIGMSGCL